MAMRKKLRGKVSSTSKPAKEKVVCRTRRTSSAPSSLTLADALLYLRNDAMEHARLALRDRCPGNESFQVLQDTFLTVPDAFRRVTRHS